MSASELRRLKKEPEWSDLEAGLMPTASADCADLVRSWERMEQAEGAVPAGMPAGERERMRAKALVLASLANEDPVVVQWRTEHLGGKLVPLSSVGEWVRSHQTGQGSPRQLLAFPDQGQLCRVATSDGSVLRSLLSLSSRLALEYGWTEDTATAFVLSDAVPIPKWVRVTVHETGDVYGARIILDVDPDTPAEVVARLYDEERKAMGRAHRPPAPATFAILSDWVSRDCPKWTRLPLRRWDGLRASMSNEARPLTRATARRSLLRSWEYLTGEPFSRN